MERIVKPVFWTTRATKDLEKITKFYIHLYGFSKAIEIAESIQKLTEILENPNYDFSEIGNIDKEFSHLKRDYKKLIPIY